MKTKTEAKYNNDENNGYLATHVLKLCHWKLLKLQKKYNLKHL
jgi:hypothetical protein